MGALAAATVDYDTVGDTRDDPNFVPLKVTAEMASELIYFDDGLCLDGPLAWAVYAGLPREVRDQMPPPDKCAWIRDFEMPVAKWTAPVEADYACDDRLLTPDGKLWGWCVSHVTGEWEAAGQAGVRKMAVSGEVKRWTDRAKINLASGRFKPSDKIYPTRRARQLHWHVLGDPEGVRELLERVTHMGKNRQMGYGRLKMDARGVPAWTVEEVDDDRSVFDDGQLMRRMPYAFEGLVRPARPMAVRAPSWHRCRYHMMMEADHV